MNFDATAASFRVSYLIYSWEHYKTEIADRVGNAFLENEVEQCITCNWLCWEVSANQNRSISRDGLSN